MAEMRVERQSILEYLSKNIFVIPMYQRPYAWGEDECNQLWEDIIGFYDEKSEGDYFLGTSVLFKEKQKQNLIDGQQRTTTLILLIRALYQKALRQKNEKTMGLVDSLESCLWEKDDISGSADYTQPRLSSEVAIDSDREILQEILGEKYLKEEDFGELKERAGITKKNKKGISQYASNFLFFIEKSDEIAKERPMEWEKICIAILKRCVILPIECDSQENALRIFNTLNNRGIPLSDSDIFKGIIFSAKKTDEAKKEFAEQWKDLETEIKNVESSMDFIFMNYMHIVRARNSEKDNVIGLRRFFNEKYRDILKEDKTFEEIQELTRYWCGEYYEHLSSRTKQFYEVLDCLPNDYWKYLDSVYYFYYKDRGKAFFTDGGLEKFLARVVANFLVKLIEKPTIATIKPITYNAYTSLYKDGVLDFRSNAEQILKNKDFFKQQFFKAHSLIPSLLLLNLYLKYPEQETDISGEIEHIFPKTTQWRSSYTGWDKEEAHLYIESIGNKMWLEKRWNIKASNGYFDNKKEKYRNSDFLEAKELANSSKNDWLKADIEARNEEIFERLYRFFLDNL